MLKRILTATVLLVLVFAAILGFRQIFVEFADILGIIICCLGVYEMAYAFKKAEYNSMKTSLIFGCILIYPLTLLFEKTIGKGEVGIIVTLVLSVMIAIVEFTFVHKYELKDLLATIFILIYPLSMFSIFFIVNHSQYGMLGIFLALFIPVMSDTMAYFTGITFKGKKLCPEISPKKTISGAIGGLSGGIIGAMLVYVLFDVTGLFVNFNNVGIMHLSDSLLASAFIYLAIGLVGGVLSEVGDLGASWIKRKAGIKDFGKIFPGHGGMMDRLDSILFVLPLVYLVINIVSAVNA